LPRDAFTIGSAEPTPPPLGDVGEPPPQLANNVLTRLPRAAAEAAWHAPAQNCLREGRTSRASSSIVDMEIRPWGQSQKFHSKFAAARFCATASRWADRDVTCEVLGVLDGCRPKRGREPRFMKRSSRTGHLDRERPFSNGMLRRLVGNQRTTASRSTGSPSRNRSRLLRITRWGTTWIDADGHVPFNRNP
jgi:hypothetical protein